MTPTSEICTLRGVLIDVDGTLLDSNDAHAEAWRRAFEQSGRRIDLQKIRPLIGKGGDKVLMELAGLDSESDAGKAISAERGRVFEAEYLDRLSSTPGARALLQRFAADGLKRIVATSSSGPELKRLLRQAGVEDLIDESATSSDADASKPDPDVLQVALRKSGLEAHEVFMLGDTPYDIAAAQAAKVDAVALRCGGGWSDHDLAGAAAIFDDPADMLNRLVEFTPYRPATGS